MNDVVLLADERAFFISWRFRGLDYIGARNGDGYGIADVTGNYYGAWQDVKNFRRLQRAGDNGAKAIGKISSISVRSV
jgi:hypothetical protein